MSVFPGRGQYDRPELRPVLNLDLRDQVVQFLDLVNQ